MEQGLGTKKLSTVATDRGRIERHIKPLLGKKKVPDVTKAHIKRFQQDVTNGKTAADVKTGLYGRAIVRGGAGTASRTLGLLGGIFSFAIDNGMISENPVRGVKRQPDKKYERYLTHEEVKRLNDAFQCAEESGCNPFALSILRLLMLTGARRNEIAGLKFSEFDLDGRRLRLGDSKTGQRSIPLNDTALQILKDQPSYNGSCFVFPTLKGDGFYQGTPKVWREIRKKANLVDVRIHDLRHSFASFAVSNGASLPMIGALLGHKDSSTTMRYAHLHDDPLRQVSEGVSDQLDV